MSEPMEVTHKTNSKPEVMEVGIHEDMVTHIKRMMDELVKMQSNPAVSDYLRAIHDYNSFVEQVARISGVDIKNKSWALDLKQGRWVKQPEK